MSIPSNYVLGSSEHEHEHERLMLQARILRPYTEMYFRSAGLVSGMRVLDLGSAMGDVALLSGDIVGPGGRVVFHEVDFSMPPSTYPPCELYDQLIALIPETFRRVGLPPDFGRCLAKTYVDAGLPFPTLAADVPANVAPRYAELGLALPAGVAADSTLAAMLEAAVTAQGSQLRMSIQYRPGPASRCSGTANQVSECAAIGRRRRRFPVAANIALQTAGATGGTAASPIPPGSSLLGTRYTSSAGISLPRSSR